MPVLGVAAGAAHVPLSNRTALAGDGVGLADDAHREVARLQPAAVGCFHDTAERLVAEHQPLATWLRPAILAVGDLQVGAAHPDR
jgi:hypothetical protein